MYRNSYYLLTEDCLYLIFIVEDTYAPLRENGKGTMIIGDDNCGILKIQNELMVNINNKYSFILNDKMLSLIEKFKKMKIAVNRIGDEEIITEHTVEFPEIFIGQLIAYSRL